MTFLPRILVPLIRIRRAAHIDHEAIRTRLRVADEHIRLEPVHEQRLVVDGIVNRRGWIAVAEAPADQRRGVDEGQPPVVRGRVVGVEGLAHQPHLLFGDQDRVRDVEELGQAGGRVRGVRGGPEGREVHGADVGGEEGLELRQEGEEDGVRGRRRGVGRVFVGVDLLRVRGEGGQVGVEDVLGLAPQDGVAREEPGRVELGRERHDARESHQAVRRAVAEEALNLGRAPDASAGVGADSEVEPGI